MSSHHIYSHTCEKCQQSYSTSASWGSKRFCSRACANSRVRPQELRAQVSNTLKGRKPAEETCIKISQTLKGRPAHNKGKSKSQTSNCVICDTLIKATKKVCSKECFRINQRNHALNQERHGGGHKGKYKGIPCDSTYELAYLIWHLDHSVDITRCESVYQYVYKDQISSYKPDFVVEGIEIEVKGFMSPRAQAKLDQNSHVFVVDKFLIKPFIQYVKQTYQVKDLRDLYDVKTHQKHCVYCAQLYTPKGSRQQFCGNLCSRRSRLKCS